MEECHNSSGNDTELLNGMCHSPTSLEAFQCRKFVKDINDIQMCYTLLGSQAGRHWQALASTCSKTYAFTSTCIFP